MLGLGSTLAMGAGISAQEPERPSGFPRLFGGLFLTAQQPAQPPAPAQPPSPAQAPAPGQPPAPGQAPGQAPANAPTATESTIESIFKSSFSAPGETTSAPAGAGTPGVVSTNQQQQLSATPSTGVVSGAEATTRATSDAGDLLSKSFGSVGVEVQRRNPITTDPHIRGYYHGQIVSTGDGAYWTPARVDLDTIVSRLDSASIANILVLKGPYSVRHGPGFAFLDVETLSAPRYNSFEVHGSSSLTYKTNNQAFNGRQAIWGGAQDYGFRLDYDIMAANDYTTGGGDLTMPASYNSQDFNFTFGVTLTPDSRVEFRALHVSQRNNEFPGIVTDLTKSITDGYTMRYISENQEWYDRLSVDAWYNDARFAGDSLNSGKARQIPQLNNFVDVVDANGNIIPNFQAKYSIETNGQTSVWGFREALSWGQTGSVQFTTGLDFNTISSAINEYDTFVNVTQNFPLPRSSSIDPGIFADGLLPVGERMKFKVGARLDWNQSEVRSPATFPALLAPGFTQNQFLTSPAILGPDAFTPQNFLLWSAYATAEYKLSNEVIASLGYGHAQRAPTLTELFAAGTFLGVLQPGLTFVNGDPTLKQETLNQVDFGMKSNYEYVRAGGNLYFAHIQDYITYQNVSTLGIFTGYRYINTPSAVLGGGEAFGEADLLDWLTAFGTLYYTRGQDLSRNEALPNILPLDSRVGLRIHEPGTQPRWGSELGVRMVGPQNQVAYLLGNPASGGTNELPTAGFTVVDIRGYWAITKNCLATAGIENLFDRFYREHLDYRSGGGVYQPGINGYFGLRVTY